MEMIRDIRTNFSSQGSTRLFLYIAAVIANIFLLIALCAASSSGSDSVMGIYLLGIAVSGILYYLTDNLTAIIALIMLLFGLAFKAAKLFGTLLFFIPGFGWLFSYGLCFGVAFCIFLGIVTFLCFCPAICIPILTKLADFGILSR